MTLNNVTPISVTYTDDSGTTSTYYWTTSGSTWSTWSDYNGGWSKGYEEIRAMQKAEKQSAALTLKRKTLLNELEKESVRIMSEAFSKRKKLNTRLSRTDALDIVRGKLTELAHKYNGNDIIKDYKIICDFSNNPVKENKVVVDVYLNNDSEDNFKRIELAR